jgi:hypothetical protein
MLLGGALFHIPRYDGANAGTSLAWLRGLESTKVIRISELDTTRIVMMSGRQRIATRIAIDRIPSPPIYFLKSKRLADAQDLIVVREDLGTVTAHRMEAENSWCGSTKSAGAVLFNPS